MNVRSLSFAALSLTAALVFTACGEDANNDGGSSPEDSTPRPADTSGKPEARPESPQAPAHVCDGAPADQAKWMIGELAYGAPEAQCLPGDNERIFSVAQFATNCTVASSVMVRLPGLFPADGTYALSENGEAYLVATDRDDSGRERSYRSLSGDVTVSEDGRRVELVNVPMRKNEMLAQMPELLVTASLRCPERR